MENRQNYYPLTTGRKG